MLAGKIKDLSKIQYPVYATPKLDGIRALMIDGKLVSRNFKAIPNKVTREYFERVLPNNVDGELILKNGRDCGADFNLTSSAVMSENGNPNVVYYLFDYVLNDLNKPYLERIKEISHIESVNNVKVVKPKKINNEEELLKYEQKCLTEGFEGVMIRTGNSPYKCGRSTEREGYLLKIKRFEDSEAKIIGFEEKNHNQNEAEEDVFGRTKRSQKKAGMVGANTLGKILVKDVGGKYNNIEFKIGTGFNDELRKELWNNKSKYLGKIVKYKFQPNPTEDSGYLKPRFPVFLGFRHKNDIGE